MTRPRTISLALLALDIIASVAVFNIIAHFRGILTGQWILWPLAAPIVLSVFAIYLIQGYKSRTDMLSVDYTSQHTIALLGAMIATLLLTYAIVRTDYELQSSRSVIVFSFITLVPFTLVYRRLIYLRVISSRQERRLVFLGDRASSEGFRAECERMGVSNRVIFSSGLREDAPGAPSALASDDSFRPFDAVLDEMQSGRLDIEAIILRESAQELPADLSRRLVQLYFAGVPTYTLELFHEVYWQKIPIYRLNQTWLFQEGFQIAREPVFERLKRAGDVALSSIGLLLSVPFIAVSALAVWVEDRGPMFFIQTRIGKNHVPFQLIKLRTMRPAAPGEDPYTRAGDARITQVGRLLRATRLDELPQMWNVLRGDMSLIGPRAEWDRLVMIYENEIPCYHFRHLVKPGITGWAQVNYPYGASIEDTTRKLEYDLYYIRHFSFMLDASIVLKTIHIMLFGKGR